jgi:hypothetical protein
VVECAQILEGRQVGMSGNLKRETTIALQERDHALSELTLRSERVGDRVARFGWQHALWFVDFTYVLKKDGEWRKGREYVFGREYRTLPVFLDSCGYRARLAKTRPSGPGISRSTPGPSRRSTRMATPPGTGLWTTRSLCVTWTDCALSFPMMNACGQSSASLGITR